MASVFLLIFDIMPTYFIVIHSWVLGLRGTSVKYENTWKILKHFVKQYSLLLTWTFKSINLIIFIFAVNDSEFFSSQISIACGSYLKFPVVLLLFAGLTGIATVWHTFVTRWRVFIHFQPVSRGDAIHRVLPQCDTLLLSRFGASPGGGIRSGEDRIFVGRVFARRGLTCATVAQRFVLP